MFPKSDLRGGPDHWRLFDTRKSPLSGSQRLAICSSICLLSGVRAYAKPCYGCM
jgi:hypothetical protein